MYTLLMVKINTIGNCVCHLKQTSICLFVIGRLIGGEMASVRHIWTRTNRSGKLPPLPGKMDLVSDLGNSPTLKSYQESWSQHEGLCQACLLGLAPKTVAFLTTFWLLWDHRQEELKCKQLNNLLFCLFKLG